VQRNFHLVIVAVVIISVLPIGIEWFNSRRQRARGASSGR
jgi:hypothetical protein